MAQANTYDLEHGGFSWGGSTCKTCGGRTGSPWRIFYNPTFMNGDAEWISDFCENHKGAAKKMVAELRKPLIEEAKKQAERKYRYEEKKRAHLMLDLTELQKKGFNWVRLNSNYQIRINNRIDVFPTSKKYHDIKKNKRGEYRTLVGFITNYNFNL